MGIILELFLSVIFNNAVPKFYPTEPMLSENYTVYCSDILAQLGQSVNCTARQCSPLRRKFMECTKISPAPSLLMKHVVIGHRQKAPNFSAFHWSPYGSLVSIGQHFVTTRVVH